MAKDAAVASTTIFIMTIPLVSGQHRLPEAPEMEQPKRDAPLFPSPLSQSGFHRCTINDALTALTTQPKSACNTGTFDPFRESVARIARTQAAEAVRIAILETTVPDSGPAAISGRLSAVFYRGTGSSFDSNFLQNFSFGRPAVRHTSAIGIRERKARLRSLDVSTLGRFCGGRRRRRCRILGLDGIRGLRLRASHEMT